MTPELFIASKASEAIKALYNADIEPSALQVSVTRKEFTGDFTLVVFPLLRLSHSTPENTGNAIGEWLKSNVPEISEYNCVKGFLNLLFSNLFWNELFGEIVADKDFGDLPKTGKNIMVEFSSPNTNKPLHLGHIRNNLLGDSVSRLLKASGNNVIKTTLVNDRGVHICKSMLAWLKVGNGATPESTGIKGDHLVGDMYVAFNDIYKKEVEELIAGGMDEETAKKEAPCLKEAHEMLQKWEAGDKEVRDLWARMNGWVLKGFDESYKALGITFDKVYYESQTYLLGKELVQKGLDMGVFVKDPDGSVWCDLTADGLDRKLLIRSDGTSVYITQDLGTAERRFAEYHLDSHVYVVGNEQNYHFQVLKLILKKLGFGWSDNIFHLSYGMVELPEGKMKSREGTVVDADDLIQKMYEEARATSDESGKLADMSEEDKAKLYHMIGLGALKYFIIKVDPKKTMLFNPKESIDFNGNTGPFIQYTYARIRSILRKAADQGIVIPDALADNMPLCQKETELIQKMDEFGAAVRQAGKDYSPSGIANYCYELTKDFNQFYHDYSILNADTEEEKVVRLVIAKNVAKTIKNGMALLGIEVPERM